MKDAFEFTFDMPMQFKVMRRPSWWLKMQKWPLSWVLSAMLWCRLTRLREVK
ncbi:hypothetical protein LCGC14_1343500 [marine sediment metagenome]|uniref:Uncharacterized protein n=1 Tax=marine sediment metagenome TaxID=412755 RepID=A0A0F9NFD6_9ZZZZ